MGQTLWFNWVKNIISKRVTSLFYLLLFLNWAFSRLHLELKLLKFNHFTSLLCNIKVWKSLPLTNTHISSFYKEREGKRERTYHHLSSEELGDGSLNTSAFHFVLHIVQELKHTCAMYVNYSAHIHISTYRLFFKSVRENSPLCTAPVHHVAWSYLVFPTFTESKKKKTITTGQDTDLDLNSR